MAEGSGLRRAAILLAAALLSLPLWPAPEVLVDYPNHVARAYILANLDDPLLAAEYGIDADPLIPYLGLDALLVPLAALLGAGWAGRLGITAVFVLLAGATMLLDRALNGRVRWQSAAVLLVLFNALLAWGNVNYLLGLAGVLALFAGWIAAEDWPWPRRLAVFAAASTLLFLAHVLAAGVWAMLVAAYELGRLARARRWDGLAPGALQFLPAAALWLAQPRSMHVFEVSETRWGTWPEHLLALASPFTFDVWLGRFSTPTAIADWAITAAVFGGLALGGLTGRLRIDARLWAPLLLGTMFTLAVPIFVHGIWANHLRLPTLMACLLAAGSTVRWPSPRLAAALLAGLLALRLATLAPQMAACGETVEGLRVALARMPAGARLLPVLDAGAGGIACKPWQSFSHAAALAVIERRAFVPILFWENTLLDLKDPAWRPGGDTRTVAPEKFAAGGHWKASRTYDHVLWLHFGRPPDPLPAGLAALYQDGTLSLYRVHGK